MLNFPRGYRQRSRDPFEGISVLLLGRYLGHKGVPTVFEMDGQFGWQVSSV